MLLSAIASATVLIDTYVGPDLTDPSGCTFQEYFDITFDSHGNGYYSLCEMILYHDRSSNLVSVFAGGSSDSEAIVEDIVQATSAYIGFPTDLLTDPDGKHLYLLSRGAISRIDLSTHDLTRVAGNGVTTEFANDESGDNGPATSASLHVYASGLYFNTSRYLFFTDSSRIRRIDLETYIIQNYVGRYTGTDWDDQLDGPLTSALFYKPYGLWGDGNEAFVMDLGTVRKIDISSGTVSTWWGGGESEYFSSGDGGSIVNATVGYAQICGKDNAGDIFILLIV